MQRSPAAITQAGNLYMFVMHNPVRFTDPTGLFAVTPGFIFPIPVPVAVPDSNRNPLPWPTLFPPPDPHLVDALDRFLERVSETISEYFRFLTNPFRGHTLERNTVTASEGGAVPGSSAPSGNNNAANNANQRPSGQTNTPTGQIDGPTSGPRNQAGQRVNDTTDHRLPDSGEPNSITRKICRRTGTVITERHFGPDGLPIRDVDLTDHGNPKEHPHVPHYHDWNNGIRSEDMPM